MHTEAIYEELYEDNDEYRDTIATVDKDGKRIWLYPKKPKGKFFNKRILATIGFLAVFFAVPFIKIGGMPLLMMNFFDRKFVIFGQLFLPHDFVLFGIGMIIFVLFIVLFTVSFGRVWCGWLCPQTVFMEMIFRPIENWLEGDGRRQKNFDQGPMNFDKAWRKTLKHTIYIVFSIIIAHFTMAYIIGVEGVVEVVSQPPSAHLSGFIGLVVFTVLFYYVFSRLREQVCVTICPYGRLQGVLVNRDTMTIIYDFIRGEPRGRLKKNQTEDEQEKQGDCVDCGLCVQVCPTGIDIRNGIQLECVNCTACIDACDDVMEKVGKPKGLIRYASVESVEKKVPYTFSKRSMAYSVVLLALIGIEATLLITRDMVDTTILRVPGQLYQKQDDGGISNLYNAQIVNKTQEDVEVGLSVEDENATVSIVGDVKTVTVPAGGKKEVIFFVKYPEGIINQRKTDLEVLVKSNGEEIDNIGTTFLGPNK